uniref:Putative secreted peptide n=1 Tax=Anopheles braziliensis TaxID=58242 RepID=A0A2M3ZWK3_9DIPT
MRIARLPPAVLAVRVATIVVILFARRFLAVSRGRECPRRGLRSQTVYRWPVKRGRLVPHQYLPPSKRRKLHESLRHLHNQHPRRVLEGDVAENRQSWPVTRM